MDEDEDKVVVRGVGVPAGANGATVDGDDDVECVQRTVLECMRTELREASNELLALRHHLRETEEDADKYRASYEFCASRGGVESVRDRLAMLENANDAALRATSESGIRLAKRVTNRRCERSWKSTGR
jgi:hypothetical protein